MLRSDLCNFSDAYIVVKGDITLTKNAESNFIDVRNKFLAFKTTHRLLIAYQRSIMYYVLTDNAEDLNVVMQMHHMLE